MSYRPIVYSTRHVFFGLKSIIYRICNSERNPDSSCISLRPVLYHLFLIFNGGREEIAAINKF